MIVGPNTIANMVLGSARGENNVCNDNQSLSIKEKHHEEDHRRRPHPRRPRSPRQGHHRPDLTRSPLTNATPHWLGFSFRRRGIQRRTTVNEINNEKPHTCSRCGAMRSTIAELMSDIRKLCRQIEKGVGPTRKSELQAKIADFKERVRVQKEWYQEHLDDATYSPGAS